MCRQRCFGLCVAVGLLLVSDVRAGIIVDVSTSQTNGTYTYSYQIENQTSVGLFAFSLSLPAVIGTIQSPNGWDGSIVPILDETLVQWVSTDVPFDVPAFGTLAGFVITSSSGPGSVTFSTLDDNFSQFEGQTTGPVASASVPEPGSFGVIATVLGVLFFRNRQRQRHPRLTAT